MAKHIFSTLNADTRYTSWGTQPGVNTMQRSVLVRGGAGVAQRSQGTRVYTPDGVRTEVSDDDAAFLLTNKQFLAHQERGFVKIASAARDPDSVAQGMELDDGGKPKTAADVKAYADAVAKKSGLQPGETLQVTTNMTTVKK
jgi:hypothetical protein